MPAPFTTAAMRLSRYYLLLISSLVSAQPPNSARPAAPDPGKIASLIEAGHCSEGLPAARKAYARAGDPDLKRRLGTAGVRCAMALDQPALAAEFIGMLNRDFPRDPDVLYLTVHTYSDLSVRASQKLLLTNPGSDQVHRLNAEALESQGKWDEAVEEYRTILKRNPAAPGIHYCLGRAILSRPETPTTRADAKKEFEEELRIDPKNAGAEFILGELARQGENYDEAIDRFTRATRLDAMFTEAYLGLGRALLAVNKPSEAVNALERAAALQPDNPASHFLLANAYRKAGRPADAERAMAAHKAALEKAQQKTDELKLEVNGAPVPAR